MRFESIMVEVTGFENNVLCCSDSYRLYLADTALLLDLPLL